MAGDCVRGRDGGYFTVGWFTRIVLTMAIIGVFAIDGISLALGHVRIQDAASQAASAASDAYLPHHSFEDALTAAQKTAEDNDTTLSKFAIADGNVDLTVRGTISTTVVKHLPGTASLVSPSEAVSLKIVLS
jgi:hypothetical protein